MDAVDMTLTKHFTDVMDPARAQALMATLGVDQAFTAGDPIPSFAHYLYFWEALIPDQLGRDSHPKIGDFIPDLGLPRRMWAGGTLDFEAPLLAGELATKTSVVQNTVRKEGRSGPLVLVTLTHTVEQTGRACIREQQDIVYLPDRDPDTPHPSYPLATTRATHTQAVTFDTTTLFRYSALTFNGHRIHYDLEYCQQVEGYAGLVVHGPLLAQMVMLFWEQINGRKLRHFTFRMTAPLMHFERATLCLNGSDVWVEGPDRRLCLVGSAR
ncbi:MAG: FAS1-like dehydratase domain-containing protein [Planktomarina sp.]